MGPKKLKNTFKKTLTNHITKKGQKYSVEKTLTKSLKNIQKKKKKILIILSKDPFLTSSQLLE